jgi:hypothetical protein
MADGLVIATDKLPGTTCLVPVDGVDEWQVWNIHKETAQAWVSFRSFLEYEVGMREPITTVEELREVIGRAEEGDHLSTMRVSRTTVPEAVEILVAVIERASRAATQAVLGLGRIGTAEAVDALARLNPRPVSAEGALALAGTEHARDVLVRWGAVDELSLLGDPRAASLAAEQLALSDGHVASWRRARFVLALGRSRDPQYVRTLLDLQDDERDPWLAISVAQALVWLGAPEGRHRLTEIAAADGPGKGAAAYYLRVMDDGFLP